MISIIDEITTLRGGNPFQIDLSNNNRYRIVALESDGSKTAYYFSAPIYNTNTRKLIDMKFHTTGNIIHATGSNANVTISNKIQIKNDDGCCIFSLSHSPNQVSDHEVSCGTERIYPTTNGIAIRSYCKKEAPYTITLEINKPFLNIRANDKYFALMSEQFKPFVSISCIGTEDSSGKIIAPAKISYQKIRDRIYTITIIPCSAVGRSVLIEANLYESKLFQDTTVESKNPKTNNAFGSVAFIGNSNMFWDQWLYSKLDYGKIPNLNDKKIKNIVLHIPKLNNDSIELTASKVSSRFCSFGSTWSNKIADSTFIGTTKTLGKYLDLNLTYSMVSRYNRLERTDGFILKGPKSSSFSVIATGDNYLTPQVLEINYF